MVDPTALALCIVFPLLSIVAVIARFRARAIQKCKPGADDWVVVVALLFSIGNAINILYGAIKSGLGQHIPLDRSGFAVNGPKLVALEKMTYVTEVVACVALGFARWSVLLLYHRIFDIKIFRIFVYIFSALNLGWVIAFVFAFLFRCTPVTEVWTSQQGQRKHCIGIESNYYYAVISVVLDFLVLSMPWPVIWRMKMATRQKIEVTGVFLLGAIVTAAGIGKCYAFFTVGATIAKDHDLTYDEAPLFYWTLPECSLAVVCACLPILRPVLKGSWPVSLMRSLTSLLRSNGSSTDGTIITKSGWKNGTPEESKVRVQKVSSSSESGDMVEVQRGDLESGTSDITVHRDFNVHEARGDVQK